MAGSILDDVKKVLGLDPTYTAFDLDIIIHINSVFSILNQLGIGPAEGYMIEDNSPTWYAFIGDDTRLMSVKTYMYLRVRMLFDRPDFGPAIDAMNKQIQEFEWRLSVKREGESWADPNPAPPPPPTECFW